MRKIILYFFPLLFFLPIYIFRDYTPNNELRYISIIRDAVNNGSLFVFSNHGVLYADKPPLYFWIMMLFDLISDEHLLLLIGIFNLFVVGVILSVLSKWCFPSEKKYKYFENRCRKCIKKQKN